MSDLLSLVSQQISGDAVGQLSRAIGADRGATATAIETALPLLVGGLANNANRSAAGAQALAGALDRDHRAGDLLEGLGSLLGGGGAGGAGAAGVLGGLLGGAGGGGGLLGGLLGGAGGGGGLGDLLGAALGGGAGKAVDGGGILKHIFGGRRGTVESGMSRASGLDIGQVGKLLTLLAPLVMSALAKVKNQRGLDGPGLAGYLGEQRSSIEQRTPKMASGGLMDLLDRDDDGSIADDIARLGAALGGPLLGR